MKSSKWGDQTHNLNPHRPAVAAMCIWGDEYAAQDGGVMDFWVALSPSRKRVARDLMASLERARDETKAEATSG